MKDLGRWFSKCVLAGALVAALHPAIVRAQGAKAAAEVVAERAQRGDSADSAESNRDLVKLNARPDRAAAFVRNARKGGTAKGSARYFEFTFDNWTDLYLECYYQGDLVGMMRPWGEMTLDVSQGTARVSCYAPGQGLRWGPRRLTIRGDYTWKLEL